MKRTVSRVFFFLVSFALLLALPARKAMRSSSRMAGSKTPLSRRGWRVAIPTQLRARPMRSRARSTPRSPSRKRSSRRPRLASRRKSRLPVAGRASLEFFARRTDPVSGQNDVAVTFEARIDSEILTTTVPPFGNTWQRYRVTTQRVLPAGTHTLTFTFTRGPSLFGRAPVLELDAVSVTLLKTIPIFEGFDIPEGPATQRHERRDQHRLGDALVSTTQQRRPGERREWIAHSTRRDRERFSLRRSVTVLLRADSRQDVRQTPNHLSARAPSISGEVSCPTKRWL